MAQSGPGEIVLFNDFTGVTALIADTADYVQLQDFYAGGEGFEDNDAGVQTSTTAPESGAITITGANTDADTTFVGTALMFDVALMGPLVLEARLQIPDVDTKEIFIGFTSILTYDEQLEDIIINASATTFTAVADLVGFYYTDELTASKTTWHAVHKGGTAATPTTAAATTLGVGPTTGEWQIVRLEVDPNGDARFFVDGVLEKTVAGAASTTSNMAAVVAFAANTTEFAIGELDYLLVKANRDWTV